MLTSTPSNFLRSTRLNRVGKGFSYLGFAALLTMTAATAQIAAGTTGIDATGNAKSEMAACTSGKTRQARDACMKEVRNANAEKRAGKLSTGTDYAANAMKRCDVFKEAEDQAACKDRMMSESKAQGGVADGGVLRQGETVVPAPAQ